jgi:hypothetical protein
MKKNTSLWLVFSLKSLQNPTNRHFLFFKKFANLFRAQHLEAVFKLSAYFKLAKAHKMGLRD